MVSGTVGKLLKISAKSNNDSVKQFIIQYFILMHVFNKENSPVSIFKDGFELPINEANRLSGEMLMNGKCGDVNVLDALDFLDTNKDQTYESGKIRHYSSDSQDFSDYEIEHMKFLENFIQTLHTESDECPHSGLFNSLINLSTVRSFIFSI